MHSSSIKLGHLPTGSQRPVRLILFAVILALTSIPIEGLAQRCVPADCKAYGQCHANRKAVIESEYRACFTRFSTNIARSACITEWSNKYHGSGPEQYCNHLLIAGQYPFIACAAMGDKPVCEDESETAPEPSPSRAEGGSSGAPENETESEAEREPAGLTPIVLEIVDVLSDAKGKLETIQRVKEIVEEIENGEEPSVDENQWSDLADQYDTLASRIEAAELPDNTPPRDLRVPIGDAMRCATRASAVSRLERYSAWLKDNRVKYNEALRDIDRSQDDVRNARSALRYVINAYDELVSIPIYGEIFAWDWFELENDVKQSLNRVSSALTTQKRRINSNLVTLNTNISNLDQNLVDLRRAVCIP